MAYKSFAAYYDDLMQDVGYENWIKKTQKHLDKGSRMLDIGCGTGSIAIPLAKAGYDVVGVDLSEDMLVMATEKTKASGLSVAYVQQDMRELSGFSDFDGALIAVDSLNYLPDAASVQATFAQVAKSLKPSGILIFDVHSIYKMDVIWDDFLYADTGDEFSYIWRVEQGNFSHSVVHELTFFKCIKDGFYERTSEIHHQRTFATSDYEKWLDEAGFDLLEVSGDFEEGAPFEGSERIIFIARKRS